MNFPLGFVHVNRLDQGDREFQTLGNLNVFDWDLEKIFDGKTLEPQWNNNREGNSCMPNGWYWLVKRWSGQYNNHFEIQDVNYRTYMLMHVGNFRSNTEGCVLPGKAFVDIDSDGHKDVTSSGDTMGRLNRILPSKIPILFTSDFEMVTV